MWILNNLLGRLFDVLLYPFQDLPPIVGLTVVSVITGIAMLLVFRATSDQEGLRAVKRRIHAGIFEIRLFNDDPRAILRAQADILRHSLTYLRLSLVPMLWMIIPLLLVLIQLQFHYGYGGLEPGSKTIVKVKFKAGSYAGGLAGGRPGGVQRLDEGASAPPGPSLSLEVPPGIRVESPLLWIPSLGEADWRVAAQQPGEYELHVRVGEDVFGKRLRVSEAVVRRSPVRPSSGLLDQLLYPVEPPLPADAPIESITVSYPEGDVSLLGWETHWLVVFFILTVVVAFALQRPFKVTL